MADLNFALVIVGNGRLNYLHQVIEAAEEHLPYTPHLLMVDDSGDLTIQRELLRTYPDYEITLHDTNKGMAAAVQSGFNAVLRTDADYAFWLEEDMLLTDDPPLTAAARELTAHPTLAQMCFRREPWWGSPLEISLGDQLAAICEQAAAVDITPTFTAHNFLFSLNPCLIPRRILQDYKWPEGPIGVGNESGMTDRLKADGYWFGSWGHPGDGQSWAWHLGDQRGARWQL